MKFKVRVIEGWLRHCRLPLLRAYSVLGLLPTASHLALGSVISLCWFQEDTQRDRVISLRMQSYCDREGLEIGTALLKSRALAMAVL